MLLNVALETILLLFSSCFPSLCVTVRWLFFVVVAERVCLLQDVARSKKGKNHVDGVLTFVGCVCVSFDHLLHSRKQNAKNRGLVGSPEHTQTGLCQNRCGNRQ